MTARKQVFVESGDDPSGSLPDIIRASYARDSKTVAALLAAGVDPNSVDPRDNLTPLHIACMNGDDELVDVLLRHDANTGTVDFTVLSTYRPRQAWQFAMNSHHYEIARKVDFVGLAKAKRGTPSFDR